MDQKFVQVLENKNKKQHTTLKKGLKVKLISLLHVCGVAVLRNSQPQIINRLNSSSIIIHLAALIFVLKHFTHSKKRGWCLKMNNELITLT